MGAGHGGTVLSKDSFQGIDDFEVIAYLIIVGEESRRGWSWE